MADVDSSLQLYDLYKESMVRELIEKTKNGGITWTYLGGTQFQSIHNVTVDSVVTVWTFYVSKTQIGSLSYRYNLDVKKNSTTYITITDGPLPNTARDSVTLNLYEIVEMMTLQLNDKVVEAVQVLQGIS